MLVHKFKQFNYKCHQTSKTL